MEWKRDLFPWRRVSGLLANAPTHGRETRAANRSFLYLSIRYRTRITQPTLRAADASSQRKERNDMNSSNGKLQAPAQQRIQARYWIETAFPLEDAAAIRAGARS